MLIALITYIIRLHIKNKCILPNTIFLSVQYFIDIHWILQLFHLNLLRWIIWETKVFDYCASLTLFLVSMHVQYFRFHVYYIGILSSFVRRNFRGFTSNYEEIFYQLTVLSEVLFLGEFYSSLFGKTKFTWIIIIRSLLNSYNRFPQQIFSIWVIESVFFHCSFV
jgi:hypothetical protein